MFVPLKTQTEQKSTYKLRRFMFVHKILVIPKMQRGLYFGLGSMLGAAVGDANGVPLEFARNITPEKVEHAMPAYPSCASFARATTSP